MMKRWVRSYKILFLVITGVVFSCDNKTPSPNNIDNFYPDDLVGNTEYDFIIELQNHDRSESAGDEPGSLKLHSTIGSLDMDRNYIFGEIKKALLFEEFIFLLDARSKQLMIFKLDNGRHIETIDIEGRGPGELLFPEDMIFDESDRTLLILDRQRKLLRFVLDDYIPEIRDEVVLDYIPENFCSSYDEIITRNRINPGDLQNESTGNIAVYNKDDYTLRKTIGDVFLSDNWLLTNQLSRGTIYCSEEDENLYSVDRYLPQLTIYKGPDFAGVVRVLFSGLKLVKIVPGFTDGLPEISYDRSNGGAIVNNVIADEDDIFVQLYELLPTLEEKITTYQIDKTNYTLKKSFDHLGTIHQVTDSLIITSINTPYPRVEIYRREGF